MPVFILLLVLFFAPAVSAETTNDARSQLKGTLDELKLSEKHQKQLEEKQAAIERELKSLQKEMVTLTRDTQEQEQALSALEEKLTILEDQKKEKTKALDIQQQRLSSLIWGMVRLRQLPPEAVIAMPGKLDETLKTARALGVVTEVIEDEARSLRGQLQELVRLSDKIKKNRQVIMQKKLALVEQQKTLTSKIKDRGKLQGALGGEAREEKERMASLTTKSQSLQELVDSLEHYEHGRVWEQRGTSSAAWKKQGNRQKRALRSFVAGRGHMRLQPGRVISHYGNSSAGPALSKGIIIETRKVARVIAPFDGEVVFAGPFRDYGRMVIIRHSDGYHTLLSGMDALDCTPGQFLLEGEPIGAMARREGGNRLYMELRKDEKPVDPLPWFKQ